MKILKSINKNNKLDNAGSVLAYSRHPNIKKPLDFLDRLESLDITSDNISTVMDVCKKLYERDYICGASIDALVNFATTTLTIEPTGNKKFDNLIKIFAENLNYGTDSDRGIYHFMQRFGLNWFQFGNVFPLKNYQILNINGTRVSLPMKIIFLDPRKIAIEESTIQFGPKVLYYKVTKEFVQTLKSDGRKNKNKRNIPSKLRKQIRKIKGPKNSFQEQYAVLLNRKLVDHIKRKASDFDDWGIPYLTRAFRPLSTLNKLIRLDEATLDGLINQFTIYKIGSDEFPADATRLRAFANLIKTRGAPEPNQHIVWQHDISVESVGPEGKILSFETRFKQAEEAVKIALGVSDVLLLGGKTTGNIYAAFLAMIENLMHLRKTQTIWLQDLLMQIADQNNIELKGYPIISWERTNLTSEAEVKNLILSFYDRGLLDPDTALMESGRNSVSIIEKKKKMIKDGTIDLFTPPSLPFDGGNSSDQKGRPEEGDVRKKDKKFESTSFEQADHSVFDEFFKTTVRHLNDKYSVENLDKNINYIKGYILNRYSQIKSQVESSNEINSQYGINQECAIAINNSMNKVISSSTIKEAISALRFESIDLWEIISNIRSKMITVSSDKGFPHG